MKKVLASVLMIALMLVCLAACSNGANRFYNSKVLKEFQITDFPKPQGVKDFEATNSRLSFNTTAEGFEDYAEQIYTYLVAKDFKYFGYRGDVISTFFGGVPEYEFYLSSEFSEHQYLVDRNGNEYENCYVFVFSDELSESNGLLNECAIKLTYRPNDEKCNTHLSISYDKNVFTGYTLITDNTSEHEHTITYISAGISGHFENFTCGCPHDLGAVPHYDENGDYICDACGYVMIVNTTNTGKVQTTIGEEAHLPQFMSIEADKRNALSNGSAINIDVYMGYYILNKEGAAFSDIIVPEEDFESYTFVLEINYNNETRAIAIENLNYFSEYKCDIRQGVVYYNKYNTIQLDTEKMSDKSYGFVNVELYMISNADQRYWVSAQTLYYSVAESEIVFGLVSNPVANEGDPGIITNGWAYQKTTP